MEIQIETASINNEDQIAILGGNEKKNDELVIDIREIVGRLEIQSSTQCRIYKVPHYLRKWNEEAYTPQVISIGPFHHKNERLKAMEELKERYFSSFVKRSEINLDDLVGKIREMEKRIRGCYDETIDLSSDRFVKMILVDASFILELLERSSKGLTSDDPMAVEPRATAVMLDLLLLENQLPFFVIKKLHHLAFPSPSNPLLQHTFIYFGKYICNPFIQPNPDVEIKHFTDLLRTFMLPPPVERPESVIEQSQHTKLLYSATQLREAGVKFEVVKSECRFDINFEKGVLKIPSLELMAWTEVVTRNIMALEQTHYIKDTYFTDYLILMDSLINTREDVDLLRKKKNLGQLPRRQQCSNVYD